MNRIKQMLLFLFAFFIIPFIFIPGCQKDIEPNISITNLNSPVTIYVRDTLRIEYIVNEENLESVDLIVNGSNFDSQSDPLYYFNFVPDSTIQCRIELAANYTSGKIITSNRIFVYVNQLSDPPLRINCSRDDGDPLYFVGEQLLMEVEAKYSWADISNSKKMTLSLNGDTIGVLTSPPFIFNTPIIEKSENDVHILLVDSADHVHLINMTLHVPINTPPEIELKFKHSNVITSGYYYTTDSVFLEIKGSDNIYIKYVDFYFENEYIATDSVNSDWFFGRKLNLGKLSAGNHFMHCIAYDARGLSTVSDTLDCIVFSAFDINEEILDIENTDQVNLSYLLSSSHLFRIDPDAEELSEIVGLPFSGGKTMDYVNEDELLYIGFDNGQFVYWDENLLEFITVETQGISNIEDVEIDHLLNLAYLISNQNLIALHLSTGTMITWPVALPVNSTLLFDSQSNNIVAGGDDNSSNSWVYKLKYENNLLICEDSSKIGASAIKLILKPNHNQFLIHKKSFAQGNNIYDIQDFGQIMGMFEMYHPESASFNSDGSEFYLGNNLDNEIFVYNTGNYSKINSFYIPLDSHIDVKHMITDVSNSKLIMTTDHAFDDDVKLIFVRLN